MRTQQRSVEEELLAALVATDSLEAFRQLPLRDQENFFRWIEKAPAEESRWRRTDALVLAMRISCLRLEGRIELASEAVRRRALPSKEAAPRTAEASGLIRELQDPEFFDILENVIDQFLEARDDRSVHESLEISQAFLTALREAKCLDLFQLLPASDQGRFLRWIGSTKPVDVRMKRIQTFVSALKSSPLEADA